MSKKLLARPVRAGLTLVLLAAAARAQAILPPPSVPAGNPQMPAKELLGKALFWDEQLSSSRTVACGTCHRFGAGGGDPRTADAPHPGSDGAFGTADDGHGSFGLARQDAQGGFVPDPAFGLRPQVTGRKAPAVVNAAYAVALFDDGRASGVFRDPLSGSVVLPSGAALESQGAQPPVSPVEMAHLGRTWSDVVADLAPRTPLALARNLPAALQQFVTGQSYATLFQQVFGSPGVTPVRVAMALAAYQRTLVSDQSRFDLYLAGRGALSGIEQAGLVKFQQTCAGCHTDLDASVLIQGPVLDDYRNIGVRPVAEDPGRFAVTGLPDDLGRFRVPGLRNVALRAPYFHNGSAASLGAVVDFYARGGDFHDHQDPLLAAIPGHISIPDRLALVALLNSLTDPRLSAGTPPFDRPTLGSEGALAQVARGTGTAGSGAVAPRVAVNGAAFLGNSALRLGLDHAAPGVLATLALDVAVAPAPILVLGQELYLALTPALLVVGLPGPTQGPGPGAGTGSVALPVPAAAELSGLVLWGQWLVLDPLGPAGLASSDALGVTLH